MDASTIAEGIFIGAMYVLLAIAGLRFAVILCAVLYEALGAFLIRCKVERLFRRGK